MSIDLAPLRIMHGDFTSAVFRPWACVALLFWCNRRNDLALKYIFQVQNVTDMTEIIKCARAQVQH